MELNLSEVIIPGVERFRPDVLKHKDEADLKKLAAWRNRQNATATETSPARWKQRKARGGINSVTHTKSQGPPVAHEGADEHPEEQYDAEAYEDRWNHSEEERLDDIEADHDSAEEQGDEYDEVAIRIPRGSLLDPFWLQASPGAALSLLNGIAAVSRSASKE